MALASSGSSGDDRKVDRKQLANMNTVSAPYNTAHPVIRVKDEESHYQHTRPKEGRA